MSASKRPTHLVADAAAMQGVEVELGRQRVADLVHDRQLRQALAHLVDQADVLEGDAQARRERGEQLDIQIAEGILPVKVLERDDASDLVAHRQRDPQPGQSAVRPGGFGPCSTRYASPASMSRLTRSGRARLDHSLPEAADGHRLVGESNAPLDGVREVDNPGLVLVDHPRCRRPGRRRSPGSGRRPGRTSPACRVSSARPRWTSLIRASSAARSFVSVRRRRVSSNSRAFSRATLRLAARA